MLTSSRHTPQLGYLIEGPARGIITAESDTFTCNHCNNWFRMKPLVPGKCLEEITCPQCDSYVCLGCAIKGGCTPFEEAVRRREARAAALRSYGL